MSGNENGTTRRNKRVKHIEACFFSIITEELAAQPAHKMQGCALVEFAGACL
jgi:hypothetical protein